MNTKFPNDRLVQIIILTLVGGSLLLAVIDPSVRPLFIEAAKAGVMTYIGRSLPELKG